MLTLLSVAPGEAIRPMGHTALAGLFVALGLFVGLPICLIGAFVSAGWRRAMAICAVVLSLTPLPLGSFTLQFVAAWVGFTLKP